MEIRELTEADAAEWWRLRLEALETEPLAFGRSVEEHRAITLAQTAERIRDKGDGSLTLGCFDSGTLIGTATLRREKGMKEGHKGHLVAVYVSGSHRGRGYGSKLLTALLDRARKDASLEQILLGVGAHNTAAIQTYQRLGFEIYGTEPRALKVGSDYVDEHLMILRLR